MTETAGATLTTAGGDQLAAFIQSNAPVFVLTGAGCSTASGIPDYRDSAGNWKLRQPIRYQEFISRPAARQRYWARSLVGWPRIAASIPNASHTALARLEQSGLVRWLTTQNVDGLHQKAGHRHVIDLHGRLDRVRCLSCDRRWARNDFQVELTRLNTGFIELELSGTAATAPDGDALVESRHFDAFNVPACRFCGGMVKPDVVFFGEPVPAQTAAAVYADLEHAGAVLVAGSSLMVFSGYRFARRAAEQGVPIAAVNLGTTRADDLFNLKVEAHCESVLSHVADTLCPA